VTFAPRSSRLDGVVFHERTTPPANVFRYGAICFRFDLDELPELGRRLPLFSYGGRAVVALRDEDYLVAPGRTVAEDFRAYAAERGVAGPFPTVELVTMARLFGYVFNPVSFALLYGPDDALRAIVAEINNTFGETHRHLFRVEDGAPIDEKGAVGVAFETAKEFHISPFLPPDLRHRFSFVGAARPRGARLRVRVEDFRGEERVFDAVLDVVARPLDARALLGAVVRRPLMTVKAIAAIHWQALKLWLRRATVYPHPRKRGLPGYARKR
jgi:DUF1365 family protein